MARFGNYSSESYWTPQYGGVDWSLRRDRLTESGELEQYQPVGFDSGDGLVQEAYQENCAIYFNEVNPGMDMVAINDPRDGKDYIWFREQNPEVFEDLTRNIGRAALKHLSFYPLENVVQVYLDRVENTYE